jgi:guanosine-3',5'-bis(diphosphate) 3'-pyrophosphohydrolase
MIGPHGVPVEVQIRTEDMDQMAEMGVAAHWAYKEHGGESSTTAQIRAQRWMQSLLELQQSAGSSFEFIESVKSDLFPDEIYVFTPEGALSNCLLVQRRSTSLTRCIPISAMPASARRQTALSAVSRSPAARREKYYRAGRTSECGLAELCRELQSARQNSPVAEKPQA